MAANSLLLLVTLSLFAQEAYLPARLQKTAPLGAPLASVMAEEVVLEGTVGISGELDDVALVEGVPPFVEALRRSARDWVFQPAEMDGPVDSRISITALFRPRTIFAGTLAERSESARVPGGDRPPLALAVSDPGYPGDSVAEGVVILDLAIDPSGAIENLQVVQDVPSLTRAAEAAVRGWTFLPAMREGRPVAGTAIVVISFLRPVVDTER